MKITTLLIICSGIIINTFAQAPTINSFSPSTANVGSLITINGTNLSNPTSIIVGGVAALPISSTSTKIVAMAMPGASIGAVSITTASGTAAASSSITITSSNISSIQQEAKLVGTGNVGKSSQGISVALSADGNTALVGGHGDSSSKGAVWVYVRNNGVWTQQGSKLLASGTVGNSIYQGQATALSADGNTAVVGGYGDNSAQGAVWIFTRTGNTWSQQGSKLLGIGAGSGSNVGYSVSVSADGNTVAAGGYNDNGGQGAVWIFTRLGTTWSQQGSKLVGTGNIGKAYQGTSVALSADGNTLVSGGYQDSSNRGAVWVFARSGTTWNQQGDKLVGTGSVGTNVFQGYRVAISKDGNTIMTSAGNDNFGRGAVWVYTKSGGIWSQHGNKLVVNDNTGSSYLNAVSLSADGNIAIIGGTNDNIEVGAIWVFIRNGNAWSQVGSKILGAGNIGDPGQGYAVAISADASTIITGGYKDNNRIGAAWVYIPSIPTTIQTHINVTACNSYVWAANGNKIYTSSNDTDSVVYTTNQGQDSTVFLHLTINYSTSGTASISACESYVWNGTTYTNGGAYTKTLINSKGCDSVATLLLTIKRATRSTNYYGFCRSEQPMLWNGYLIGPSNYLQYQPFVAHLTNAVGCDSTAELYCALKDTPEPLVNYASNGNAWPINNGGILMCSIGTVNQLAYVSRNNGNPIIGTWRSSDPNVVSVSNYVYNNRVIPYIINIKSLAVGTATIYYEFPGYANSLCPLVLSTMVTVGSPASPPVVTGPSIACTGIPSAYSTNLSGGYWYADPSAGSITSSGVFTPTRTGTVQIYYNTFGCAGSGSKTVNLGATPNVPTITYAPNTPNPQDGAPTGSFCVGKVFTVVGTPNIPAGSWSATGFASITNAGVVSVNGVGSGSIKYTYTNAAGCSNSRTMVGTGYTCVARGVNSVDSQQSIDNDFTMYPNPANSMVSLNVNTLIGTGSIVVTDLYGKTVKTQTLSMGTNTINISSLSKGMYFISTINSDGKTTKKLVVE